MNGLTDYTNRKIAKQLAKNDEKLDQSKISIIHPEIYLRYSSVNVFCGKQGSGKSLTVGKEVAKISLVNSNVHLMIYVNEEGRVDDTYEAMKKLFKIPVIYIRIDEIEEFLDTLYYYKCIYDEIKANSWEDKLEDEQINQYTGPRFRRTMT